MVSPCGNRTLTLATAASAHANWQGGAKRPPDYEHKARVRANCCGCLWCITDRLRRTEQTKFFCRVGHWSFLRHCRRSEEQSTSPTEEPMTLLPTVINHQGNERIELDARIYRRSHMPAIESLIEPLVE